MNMRTLFSILKMHLQLRYLTGFTFIFKVLNAIFSFGVHFFHHLIDGENSALGRFPLAFRLFPFLRRRRFRWVLSAPFGSGGSWCLAVCRIFWCASWRIFLDILRIFISFCRGFVLTRFVCWYIPRVSFAIILFSVNS